MGKIIPFKRAGDSPKIINFQEAVKRLNKRALDKSVDEENLFDSDSDAGYEERCDCYHPTMRGFERELREENPDCLCCICDGYDGNCPAYNPRR